MLLLFFFSNQDCVRFFRLRFWCKRKLMISVLRLPNFSRDNCSLAVARNPVETSQHNQRDA